MNFFAHWDRTIDLEAKIGEQVNGSDRCEAPFSTMYICMEFL